MKITILTQFPEMFAPVLSESILGRAADKGLLSFNIINIRDHSVDKHRKTDDTPYGGGFGMVLDGSERVDTILRMSMPWDVMVGVARRSWARNENAMTTAAEYNGIYAGQDHITLPYLADESVIAAALEETK